MSGLGHDGEILAVSKATKEGINALESSQKKVKVLFGNSIHPGEM
jgi:hypothetical protein